MTFFDRVGEGVIVVCWTIIFNKWQPYGCYRYIIIRRARLPQSSSLASMGNWSYKVTKKTHLLFVVICCRLWNTTFDGKRFYVYDMKWYDMIWYCRTKSMLETDHLIEQVLLYKFIIIIETKKTRTLNGPSDSRLWFSHDEFVQFRTQRQ